MLLLAFLPLIAFLVLFLVLIRRFPAQDWRLVYLRAAVLWGAYMVLETELLSFVRGITQPGLAAAWALPSLAGSAWLIWHRRRNVGRQPVASPQNTASQPRPRVALHWADVTLLLGVAAILAITAVIAWTTPPQTWDSLNYHMPRVAHWAQQKAVRDFTTGVDVQNSLPPGAEMIVLQVYVLTRSDRLANFVEWFSMLGYLVGAACIARQLGAGRLGQILAVVAAASLPMGIVQASSAMVDAALAFWVVCAAAEALALLRGAPAGQVVPFASLAAGLAALTKPTAVAYILPVAIFLGLVLLRKTPLLQLLKWVLVAVLLVCAVNAGHLIRNVDLYGTPFGGPFGEHANGLMAPAGVISNLLRNTALQIGLPWGPPDRLVYDAILQVHHWLKLDPNDPRTTSVGFFKPIVASTSEQRPTNPLHALLIAVSFCIILLGQTRFGRGHLNHILSSGPALAYTLTAASTFLIFSILFQWQIFGSRYLMPFFVLFTPVIGLVLAELLPSFASRLASLLLIAAAVPILISIETRPLIPIPGHAIVRSVLVESPHRLLLAGGLYLVKPYEDITNRIKDVNCDQVGLMLRGAAAEYPLWAWLGLPRQSRQIEWIATGPSTRYAARDFNPCAIICERCQDKTFAGLPLDYEYDIYQLYLKVR